MRCSMMSQNEFIHEIFSAEIRIADMIKRLKYYLWEAIYASCYILYPLIYVYNRFLKHGMCLMKGNYCKNRIRNKGEKLRIYGMGTFLDPDSIVIGDYCYIGENAYFFALGGLTIGNNVIISRNVTIYTGNHNFHSTDYMPYDDSYIYEPVSICDNVWIGMNVSILPGVTIGKNAIIGMGAIVSNNVPENAIVVGHNRIIGYRKPVKEEYKLFNRDVRN